MSNLRHGRSLSGGGGRRREDRENITAGLKFGGEIKVLKEDGMRNFDSGATRDSDDSKIDYEGIMSPLVLQAFGEYMTKHSIQADGERRTSDNWQKGIPKDAYMKSGFRHFMDWWLEHD